MAETDGYSSFDESVQAARDAAAEAEQPEDAVEEAEAAAPVGSEGTQDSTSTESVPEWQRAIDALGQRMADQLESFAEKLTTAPAAPAAPASVEPKSPMHALAQQRLGEHATETQIEQWVKLNEQRAGWGQFGDGGDESKAAEKRLAAEQRQVETEARLAKAEAELAELRGDSTLHSLKADRKREEILSRLEPDALEAQLPNLGKALRGKRVNLKELLSDVDFAAEGSEKQVVAALRIADRMAGMSQPAKPTMPTERQPGNPSAGAPTPAQGGHVEVPIDGGYRSFEEVVRAATRARKAN